MSFIAFDAAKKKTGWAFRDGAQWHAGIVDVSDARALADVLARAICAGVKFAVIENCYLGKNVHTLKTLQEAQTRIRVACEMAGLDVDLVYAHTWQAAYGITGKRDDRKLGAMRIARTLGADVATEDEADAACLCDYAERIGKQAELELRGPRGGKLRMKKARGE